MMSSCRVQYDRGSGITRWRGVDVDAVRCVVEQRPEGHGGPFREVVGDGGATVQEADLQVVKVIKHVDFEALDGRKFRCDLAHVE